jgi:hypothetical protein
MAHTRASCASCVLAAVMAYPLPSGAFETPLSDTAVREAYFMGQRHDERLANFLNKYTKQLPSPKTGPYIASVTFFTPFAQVALDSSQQSNYSAQQAEIDHRDLRESVKITVQIQFTDSYGAYIVRPTGRRSDSPKGFAFRRYDFWKDFDVLVFDKNDSLKPFSSSGQPNYLCSDDGGCTLTGATVYFEFFADEFTEEDATVEINPPEGDQVTVDFDLSSFR